MRKIHAILAILMLFALTGQAHAGDGRLVIVTTDAVKDSGLFDALVPAYGKWTKLGKMDVRVVTAGNAEAVSTAMRGDADLLLMDDQEREDALVKSGDGDARVEVMYNDYVIVGPKDDPAKVSGSKSATDAMRRIFDKGSSFVSRGDGSGAHSREKALWKLAGRDPSKLGRYVSSGRGMADTVRMADENKAYALVDRATYNKMRWKLKRVRGMLQGGQELVNRYSAVAVSPKKHPNVNHEAALDFIEFLTGSVGQRIIKGLKDEHGGTLFVPSANR